MKYSDIINFNPIQTVIQLKDANDDAKAKNLVESYVMSDEMAEKFNSGIIEELQFDEVVDNKGVLIVGNYGTGKSHLMSLISAIANNEENLNYLGNKKFADYSQKVAGKFEVLRIEIGSVSNSLRNIITGELEKDLEKRGVTFKFPKADEITNNKEALIEMMYKFEEKYPDKGYLLVVDELLDYLRTRKEQELILDLNFLREVGEFIKDSRFRLICGIQEQLFDNPTFSFVANSLNRVKDRFEQVIIRKEDTAYVVSERILGKTNEQKAMVREHLAPYHKLYSGMSERIDDYVDLYPIHPAYIDIFNRVYIAENREVLRTISLTVEALLDQDIPEEAPGIISFDSYWTFIKDNYARKSEFEVKEVMEKSAVLEEKIKKTFPRGKRIYKDMALQIIYALSVHRLTTSGIDVRIGLTAEDLRDDLCLFMENMPEMDADFLLATVQTSINEVITLVSGQFIEHNKDNGQYFLDLKKDIDYDAKIQQKVDMMIPEDFNRYFNRLIYSALEWNAEQYVTNFDIYEYTLNWESRNVYREGYLFMGLPTERSTAQPPRDFYIYILPPYLDKSKIENPEPDEVLFKFTNNDEFHENLSLFAAASAMRQDAAEQNTKNIYGKKVETYRKNLLKWLNENKNTCFSLVYQGSEKTLIEATGGKSRLQTDLKSSIDLASSMALEKSFQTKYPEFPNFKNKITIENRAGVLERVIKSFAGKPSQDVLEYLDSFGLIRDGKIDVTNSKYAMEIIKLVKDLPRQGVLNRSDFIEEVYDNSMVKKFNIDLGYFAPVLLALVYTGHITITLKDNRILSASNMEITARLGNMDMQEFKYISKPKEAAMVEISRLLEILKLPTGLAASPKELEKGLDKILEICSDWAGKAINIKQIINNDFNLWGEPLIQDHFLEKYEKDISIVVDEFGGFASKYNTPAKFNNLNLTLERIEEIGRGIETIELIKNFIELRNSTGNLINYISKIEIMDLPSQLMERINQAKEKFRDQRDSLKEGKELDDVIFHITSDLKEIKKDYIDFYIKKHQKLRLNHKSAVKLNELKNSDEITSLNRLKNIEGVFSVGQLNVLEKTMSDLIICYDLEVKELEDNHVCRHCKLKDLTGDIDYNNKIDSLEEEIVNLLSQWEDLLIQYIEDPVVLENMDLLNKNEKEIVQAFMGEKKLPQVIEPNFTKSFNLLFSELNKVTIKLDDLSKELLKIGPTTVENLKDRISDFIDQQIKNMDTKNLRIILKDEESNYNITIKEEGQNG